MSEVRLGSPINPSWKAWWDVFGAAPHRGVPGGPAHQRPGQRLPHLLRDADADGVTDSTVFIAKVYAGALRLEQHGSDLGQDFTGLLDAGGDRAVLEQPPDGHARVLQEIAFAFLLQRVDLWAQPAQAQAAEHSAPSVRPPRRSASAPATGGGAGDSNAAARVDRIVGHTPRGECYDSPVIRQQRFRVGRERSEFPALLSAVCVSLDTRRSSTSDPTRNSRRLV
jgi:hypothetical protein